MCCCSSITASSLSLFRRVVSCLIWIESAFHGPTFGFFGAQAERKAAPPASAA
jgi:hypothetical protein